MSKLKIAGAAIGGLLGLLLLIGAVWGFQWAGQFAGKRIRKAAELLRRTSRGSTCGRDGLQPYA